MYDVVTIGDTFQDVFITPHKSSFKDAQIRLTGKKLCLKHGEKILVDQMNYDLGGSACNVAVGLAKLDLKSAIISAVGADEPGQRIKNLLLARGVETRYLKTFPKISTNYSSIIVFEQERTVLLYRGLKDYTKLNIPKALATKWLYLGPVSEEFSEKYNQLISMTIQKGIKLVINPGHRQIMQRKTDLKKLIRVAEVLILNREEALDLTDLSPVVSEKKLLNQLKTYGSKIVVVTDGANGVTATDGEQFVEQDILKVDTIDPTGAGDSFSTGFLASYIKNDNMIEALKWGVVNSALVTEAYGAQTNLQTESQIKKLLTDLRGVSSL